MSDERKPVKFWDAVNGDPDDDFVLMEGKDVAWALEDYADDDTDGLCDGLYMDGRTGQANPQPFIVEYSDGSRERWEVHGEPDIVFHAFGPVESEADSTATTECRSVVREEGEA